MKQSRKIIESQFQHYVAKKKEKCEEREDGRNIRSFFFFPYYAIIKSNLKKVMANLNESLTDEFLMKTTWQ